MTKNKDIIPCKRSLRMSSLRKQGSTKLMPTQYYVYILASKKNGTLYIGVTNNLARRVYEHKNDLLEGFTRKYKIHQLVYFETFADINSALHREKCLKRWKRAWKIKLIERNNPDWQDLYDSLM